MRLKKVPGALEIIENSKFFVKNPEQYIEKWANVFENNNPIHIEIGMGKGRYIINMAKRYQNINFIGIEMYDSVLVKAVQLLNKEETELKNLRFVLYDAKNINELFKKEIDIIYLNFSDPWPKARHAKRRLTSKVFLEKYENIFKSKKEIIMKTDNIDLFNFSLEMLKEYGYNLIEVTNDLESLKDEDNVLTEYESKFMQKGIKINRLKAMKS